VARPIQFRFHEDLRKFFDRYLRGVKNGWESTPRVRLTVLDLGGHDVVYRPEKEFPLARTQYTKLYLDAAANTLSPVPSQTRQPRDTTRKRRMVALPSYTALTGIRS